MNSSLRRIQMLSLIVLGIGLLASASVNLRAEERGFCEMICSTYCPTDLEEWCPGVAWCEYDPEFAGCDTISCYIFPNKIDCTEDDPS
jgi:hypothetical protein